MTALTLSAVRLADGKDLALENVTVLWVRASLDCPAQELRAVVAVDAAPGELGEVRVSHEGRELFTGKVDNQRFSLSARGRRLVLEARSKGAALLDNEAMPCTLAGPTMATVFRLFAQPYGFLLADPVPGGRLGSYTVHKGCCEWDAITGFARRVYGCTPYVDGDMLIIDRPRSAAELLIGGKGLPFTKLEHTFSPYSLLSKVVIRDEDGNYTLAVDGPDAAYYGVRRKRYVIPPDEFTDAPGPDANQRIRRGLLNRDTVEATLPGIVQARPGRNARIADEALTAGGLLVRDALWRQDACGVTTTLTMVRAVYYD